jgi:hypothetical protein
MATASWVIAAVTFLALGLIVTALLRSDARQKPLSIGELWAWSRTVVRRSKVHDLQLMKALVQLAASAVQHGSAAALANRVRSITAGITAPAPARGAERT